MRRKNWKSIFVKFFASYAAFVLIITIMMGSISHFFAVRAYNEEIERVNHTLLQQYENIVQNEVIRPTEALALNISSSVGMEYTVQGLIFGSGQPSSLTLLHKELQRIDSLNSPLVIGIHVYDARKNLILSSQIGLKYLSSSYGMYQYQHYWLDDYLASNARSLWTQPYASDYPAAPDWIVTRVQSISGPASSCVAIDIDYLQFLKAAFTDYTDGLGGELYLIDQNGIILTHPKQTLVGTNISEQNFPSSLLSDSAGGTAFRDGSGRDLYVSVSEPLTNGWRVVFQADTSSFYAASALMQKRLTFGALLATLLGLFLSYFFTVRMYHPIRSLTSWISKNTPADLTDSADNEYAFISRALRGMDLQVSQLNAQLDQNKELLKSNLISSLVNGTIRSTAVLERRMALLGLQLGAAQRFTALCLSLDSALTEAPNAQEVEMVKLTICQSIESLSDDHSLYIACETRSNELTAIAFFKDESEIARDTFEELGLDLLMRYQGHVQLGIGSVVDQPLDLETAYRNAQDALRYRYFHPNWLYYSADRLSNPVLPASDPIRRHAATFERLLRSGDIERAINEVHLFSYAAQDAVYPFAEAEERLRLLHQSVEEFSASWSPAQHRHCDDLLRALGESTDIRSYCYQLCAVLRESAISSARTPASKNAALVESIQQYIAQNIAEDLSLTRLAAAVGLSGSYISRVFRECCNISLVDYVTAERLERASQLLTQTDQSIESIAAQVGYPTHHYFSRRFKERYGLSPKAFRAEKKTEVSNVIPDDSFEHAPLLHL